MSEVEFIKIYDIIRKNKKRENKKMMKKYENKTNVIGELIKKKREEKGLSKAALSRKLELHAVYISPTALNKMETNRMIIKDFELIGLTKVLQIDYADLQNTIE